MVSAADAQGAVNALSGLNVGAFLGQVAGHAFTDHMSKANALAAAGQQHITKGYFEKINTYRINDVQQFKALSDKNKTKVYANYAGKKPSQLGRHVVHKSFQKTDSLNADDMATLILDCLGYNGMEFRNAGQNGRFLLFADLQLATNGTFVARSIDEHGTKTGGGGINSPGLQWAVLVLTADGANSVVISAYPSDDNYRQGRALLV